MLEHVARRKGRAAAGDPGADAGRTCRRCCPRGQIGGGRWTRARGSTRCPASGRAASGTGCSGRFSSETGAAGRGAGAAAPRLARRVAGGTPFIEVVPREHPHGVRAKGGRYRRVFISDDLDRLYGDYVFGHLCHAGADLGRGHGRRAVLVNLAGGRFAPVAAGKRPRPGHRPAPRPGRAGPAGMDASLDAALARDRPPAGRRPGARGVPAVGSRRHPDNSENSMGTLPTTRTCGPSPDGSAFIAGWRTAAAGAAGQGVVGREALDPDSRAPRPGPRSGPAGELCRRACRHPPAWFTRHPFPDRFRARPPGPRLAGPIGPVGRCRRGCEQKSPGACSGSPSGAASSVPAKSLPWPGGSPRSSPTRGPAGPCPSLLDLPVPDGPGRSPLRCTAVPGSSRPGRRHGRAAC